MKKLTFSAVLFLALLLAGCGNRKIVAENSNYVISKDEFGCYMEIDPAKDAFYDANVQTMQVIFYPKYSSVSEMRAGMLSGNLSDKELFALQKREKAAMAKGERFYVCDPDNLYELTCPTDGTTGLSHILWMGSSVSYELRGNIRGYFELYTLSESYQYWYEKYYANGIPEYGFNKKESYTNDRNATIYDYETRTGRFRDIHYTIAKENTTILIRELYALEYFENNIPVSDTVPQSIDILGKGNGIYFYGWLSDFEERPTLEWLSEFGMVPYTEAKKP